MSAVAPGLPVFVTKHAVARARLRHPDFMRRRGVAGIHTEVVEALRDGRRAKTQPRWALYYSTKRRKMSKAHGTGLYVWNEEQTRCYLLRRDQHGGPCWIVTTTIAHEAAS